MFGERRRRVVAAVVLGVLFATLIAYIVIQGTLQEAETQTEGRPTAQIPSNPDEPSYSEGGQRRFDPGKIIVSIEEDATQADLREVNRENGARIEEDLPRSDVNVVDLPSDLPVREAIAVYEDDPNIEYAEPDFLLQPAQMAPTPNDPGYNRLYGLNNTGQTGGTADADIDAPEAWNTTTGSAGTVVAVIDEGIDTSHPDLQDNLWTNPGEIAGNGVDDDRNSYVDDVNGFDFANNDPTVYDPDPVTGTGDEHGTHVAGTIAAAGNNAVGISGVAWDAQIASLKFLGADGGYTSDAVEAINYAVAEGMPISNNSWGGGGYSQSLRDAIARADTAGHLFVAAAGNGGSDGVGDNNDTTAHYPSNYDLPNVISVAASDSRDVIAPFSNYGATSVDLAAPGVGIYSTVPGNAYASYNGTSMATPHVSGVAALLETQNLFRDDAATKDAILRSVDPKANLTGKVASGGRLNAAAALGTATTPPAEPAPQPPADTTAPDTAITSGPSGTTRQTSASFYFASSESGSRFQCKLDGAAYAACTSPTSYFGLANGPHAFYVRAIDAAGNTDASPAIRTWTVDAKKPTVSRTTSRTTASTSDRTPTQKAVVSDTQTNLAKGNIRVYLDGRGQSTFSYSSATDRLQFTPRRNLSYGTHTFRLTVTDNAGNVGTASWRFKVTR